MQVMTYPFGFPFESLRALTFKLNSRLMLPSIPQWVRVGSGVFQSCVCAFADRHWVGGVMGVMEQVMTYPFGFPFESLRALTFKLNSRLMLPSIPQCVRAWSSLCSRQTGIGREGDKGVTEQLMTYPFGFPFESLRALTFKLNSRLMLPSIPQWVRGCSSVTGIGWEGVKGVREGAGDDLSFWIPLREPPGADLQIKQSSDATYPSLNLPPISVCSCVCVRVCVW